MINLPIRSEPERRYSNPALHPLQLSLAFIATMGVATALAHMDETTANTELHTYEKPLETHPSQGEVRVIEGTRAELMTSFKGAVASIHTKTLTPDHVYTLWWVVINEPAACATMPCTAPDILENTEAVQADIAYGDGIIAGEDGEGVFNSILPKGDMKGSWFSRGFLNPEGAEIHLVLNDHGPLLPSQAHSMVHSYRGGCTTESIPPAFPETAATDGVPGPNTCALVQVVVFQQIP